LTLEEKVELIWLYERCVKLSHASIADRYEITKSNVCRILQRKEEYLVLRSGSSAVWSAYTLSPLASSELKARNGIVGVNNGGLSRRKTATLWQERCRRHKHQFLIVCRSGCLIKCQTFTLDDR
jgi:hypothetical protein